MRRSTKILAGLLVVAAGGWFAGCNSTIDDGNGPAVVLEVENMTIPAVTASQDSTSGTCTYTVTNANATFKNKPKNQFASTSPFNDIILQSLDVAYVWDDIGSQPAVIGAGLGGSVPANGSSQAQFSVISNQALETLGGGRAGHTASLSMTFHGVTVSGDKVSSTTGGTLQVNSCTVNVGACCNPNGTCDTLGQVACQNQGGVYKGDNTSCSTQNICL